MAADGLDFTKRHFQSPDHVDSNWLEWFREEYSRQLYKIDIDPAPDQPFSVATTARMLPDLAIAHSQRSPMSTSHRGDSNDDISLVLLLNGTLHVQIEGTDNTLTAGMGVLGRHNTPVVIDAPNGNEMLSVRLRRHLLEPLANGFENFSVIRDTQAMRLLLGYLRMVWAEEKISAPHARHLVTTQVHDLAALAFGASADAIEAHGSVRAARLAAIKQEIMADIANPGLNARSVARRHAMTPRYVHMLFEAEGATFGEYVLERRLTQAYRTIGDPRVVQSISAIALAVGFSDLSYFNRTFRRRFGATPSDIRAQARKS